MLGLGFTRFRVRVRVRVRVWVRVRVRVIVTCGEEQPRAILGPVQVLRRVGPIGLGAQHGARLLALEVVDADADLVRVRARVRIRSPLGLGRR